MRTIFFFGILMFVLLNIALPSVDVITDILMIISLFRGAYGCVNFRWSYDYKQWQECLEDPEAWCTGPSAGGLYEKCERTTSGLFEYKCRDPTQWSRDHNESLLMWKACRESPTSFCSQQSNDTIYEFLCDFETHPKFGISMMIPYLLNYLICFLTWWRLDKKRKKTFFFPLINMYAQLGRC